MAWMAESERRPTPRMSYPDLFSNTLIDRFDNGLTVCLLPDPRVPLVCTALHFRVGTRDEETGQGGVAHYLEHMMFKGSAKYPAGAVDRRTQALGGSNNAFTSHDSTVYHFAFASDRWQEAIDIEADRMASLVLDEHEVESEKRVILEEISMVEDDPWGHLEEKVVAKLFAGHAYGRPVLGTRETVGATGAAELGAFHRRFYGPGNAVLVVVGDVRGEMALQEIAEAFSALSERPHPAKTYSGIEDRKRGSQSRVDSSRGEVPRLFAALPAPRVDSVEHAPLRLALTILAAGRSSRMQRSLVEEGRMASWLSLDLSDTEEAGLISLALEVVPGQDPKSVELAALTALGDLSRDKPSAFELERAKSILRAEWIFAHERLHQRAFTLGAALAFHDVLFPTRYREALEEVDLDQIMAVAEPWLDPRGRRVIGWSGASRVDSLP